jgi:hypothetical protein
MGAGMTAEKMPFREKFAYGFGDLASVLYWQTFMAYILFFYTDVFGITAAAAGSMLLVTRLWDGVTDPMMGVVADRTETRWGRFRPYILWLCVPFATLGVLTFTTPDLSSGGKLVWAYVSATQWILGIRPTFEGLRVAPVVPEAWKGFTARRVFRGVTYANTVVRVGPGNAVSFEVDGDATPGDVVPLPTDGRTEVEVKVRLGS